MFLEYYALHPQPYCRARASADSVAIASGTPPHWLSALSLKWGELHQTERHSPLHSLATPNILKVCYLETQKGTFQHCKTEAQVTNAQQGRLQNEGTGASCRTRIGRPWTETVQSQHRTERYLSARTGVVSCSRPKSQPPRSSSP